MDSRIDLNLAKMIDRSPASWRALGEKARLMTEITERAAEIYGSNVDRISKVSKFVAAAFQEEDICGSEYQMFMRRMGQGIEKIVEEFSRQGKELQSTSRRVEELLEELRRDLAHVMPRLRLDQAERQSRTGVEEGQENVYSLRTARDRRLAEELSATLSLSESKIDRKLDELHRLLDMLTRINQALDRLVAQVVDPGTLHDLAPEWRE